MRLDEIDGMVRAAHRQSVASSNAAVADLWTTRMRDAFMRLHERHPERDSFTVQELLDESGLLDFTAPWR